MFEQRNNYCCNNQFSKMNNTIYLKFILLLLLFDSVMCVIIEDIASAKGDPEDSSQKRKNNKFDYQNQEKTPYDRFYGNQEHNLRCSLRLETALEQIRRQQVAKQKMLNLEGYSLHKQLRSVPYDMYVTNMKVRLPSSTAWVRVEKCHFNSENASLETKLLFNDLTISGNVNLYNDMEVRSLRIPSPADTCNMIIRLRKAGIGFYTKPIRFGKGQFNIKTVSHFLEPGFISVYAYGCEPRPTEYQKGVGDSDLDMSREMEDIFLKGIKTLLISYMQRELQPAIKETLMKNMGYTISYGR